MYMWKNTVSGVECTETDVEKHLEMGKKSLQAGQFADALSHYHAAVGKLELNRSKFKFKFKFHKGTF